MYYKTYSIHLTYYYSSLGVLIGQDISLDLKVSEVPFCAYD